MMNTIASIANDTWNKRWVTIIILALVLSSFRAYTRFINGGNTAAMVLELIVVVIVAFIISLLIHGLIEYVTRLVKN